MDVLHGHDLYDEQLIDRVGDAVNEDAGDDLDTLEDGQQQQRLGVNRQMDILLDAPQEPPLGVFPAQGGPNGPPRRRKKRSFYTMTKPTPPCQSQEPEMCLLMASVTRANFCFTAAQRQIGAEYFVLS